MQQVGCKNDNSTDCTNIIQTILDLKKYNLYFPKGEYKISSQLNVEYSNVKIFGDGNSSKLCYHGNGQGGYIISIEGISGDVYYENIEICNIAIDGTNQIYKGGETDETPADTSPNPLYRGMEAIHINFATSINIHNVLINDVYGDGIILRRCSNALITENELFDCGSSNWYEPSQTPPADNHGDGITAFFSFNVKISRNTLINTRTFKVSKTGGNIPKGEDVLGKICGRTGIEFEYAINKGATSENYANPTKNPPLFRTVVEDVEDSSGVGLDISDNYIYGYTKGIHIEENVRVNVNNNTIIYNNIGIMIASGDNISINNNYIDNHGAGKAMEGQYYGVTSGVFLSFYPSIYKKNIVVDSNTIRCADGIPGVIVYNDNCIISNNHFIVKDATPITYFTTGIKNTNVINNLFNLDYSSSGGFSFWGAEDVIFEDNQVIANNTTAFINITSAKNMKIINNTLSNVRIYATSAFEDTVIDGNTFKDYNENFDGSYLISGYGSRFSLIENIFELANLPEDKQVLYSTETLYATICDNTFNLGENNTRKTELISVAMLKNSYINNNIITNNVEDLVFILSRSVSSLCNIENNKMSNTKGIIVSGQFNNIQVIENNIGKINTSINSLDQLNGAWFSNGQIVKRVNLTTTSTYYGHIALNSGVYARTAWASGTEYKVNSLRKTSAGNVYKCITAGTSTVEPTHTAGQVTESDGVTWEYVGPSVTLKELEL